MRARIKNFEDMPEKAKCCAKNIAAMLPYLGTVIEIENDSRYSEIPCPYCRANLAGQTYKWIKYPWF